MKTRFNTLMFSRFHLTEMEHLPSKKYKAVISAVLHYFYDDEDPDFSAFPNPDEVEYHFNKIVGFIKNGLTAKSA
jgi:hypothetical protein